MRNKSCFAIVTFDGAGEQVAY